MIIEYAKTYASISAFNRVALPDFTILTGVNGSGKSHLLEAISNKSVVISDIENPRIVLFNYETFRLDNEPVFTAHQLSSEREAAWQFHQQQIKPQAESWRSSFSDDYDSLKEKCSDSESSFLALNDPRLSDYKKRMKKLFNDNHRGNQHAQGIYSLAKRYQKSIDDIEHDEFIEIYKPFVFKNEFLPNQLGRIFWDYYVKYRQNQINEFEAVRHGKNYPYLSEEQFIALHGRKPWEVVNEILRQFDSIAYQVTSPEGTDVFTQFKLKLINIRHENVEVEFDKLSSGEKILMALVASVYKSRGDNHFPDVLLLDEVDASLHPSMMKNMLDVIESSFLSQGVKVILVTHSPTTIALAPDDSLRLMQPEGANRIVETSKQDALAILTQGFATIEEGLRLFDEVARTELTIITEGHNVKYLRCALAHSHIVGVNVMDGIEGITGKTQLKTLFDFFSHVTHDNKVLFVWDCDVTYSLTEKNKTYPFIFDNNSENIIARKGIENLLPVDVFEDFKKTVILSQGETIVEFDSSRKRDLEELIVKRNNPSDFVKFNGLIEKIKELCNE